MIRVRLLGYAIAVLGAAYVLVSVASFYGLVVMAAVVDD